jgi:hypothetical protein
MRGGVFYLKIEKFDIIFTITISDICVRRLADLWSM